MHDGHAFLQNLAVILCVAAVTTVVFQRLRQPVVFGYLLTGVIVGPHVPVPIAADPTMVRTLAELGVILLMFSLGLEFSIRKLLAVGRTAGLIALAETSVLLWCGYLVARAFGWAPVESVYAGAIVAISSTTIIVKAFAEQNVTGKFTEVVLGILICEDLIAIFLLAVLTTISSGKGVSATALVITAIQLATFLAVLSGVGLLIVPRFVRYVVRMGRAETTLVSAIGICFAAALLALAFGYSVALGAFIAGSLVAESGHEHMIEQLVRPVRDVFAAIFFVSVGMLIDPGMILQYWQPILAFTALVMVGKVVAVSASSFLLGYSPRTSIQAGMSLAQIGEFSFIIAGIGLASGGTRPAIYPIAVAVSAITTFATPWLIRSAGSVASELDRRLPRPLQTFAALYGSWIEQLRGAPLNPVEHSRERRLVRLLVVDALLIAGLVISGVVERERLVAMVTSYAGWAPEVARQIVAIAGIVIATPLVIGLLRSARLLGLELALRAMPLSTKGKLDFAAAPRRALIVTLQLGIILAVSVPLVAVTQPFVPALRSAAVIVTLFVLLAIGFWRRAADLQGHARAGAEVIVAALSRQMAPSAGAPASARRRPTIQELLPGFGDPVGVPVTTESPAAGKSLAQLELRGATGATIIAIIRGEERVLMPSGSERVRAGDVLALTGTHEAVEAARELLSGAG